MVLANAAEFWLFTTQASRGGPTVGVLGALPTGDALPYNRHGALRHCDHEGWGATALGGLAGSHLVAGRLPEQHLARSHRAAADGPGVLVGVGGNVGGRQGGKGLRCLVRLRQSDAATRAR